VPPGFATLAFPLQQFRPLDGSFRWLARSAACRPVARAANPAEHQEE
jgi:hypothetical protein